VFLDRLNDVVTFLIHLERRFDPFVRPAFDAVSAERLLVVIDFEQG
jgi:hypothetical protein